MADDTTADDSSGSSAAAFELDAEAVEKKVFETIEGLFRKVDRELEEFFGEYRAERRYFDIVSDELEAAFTTKLKDSDLIGSTIRKLNDANAAFVAASEKFQEDAVKAVLDAADNFDGRVMDTLLPKLDDAFGTWSGALETWLGDLGKLGSTTLNEMAKVVRDSALDGLRNAAKPIALELLDDIFEWRSVRDRLQSFGDVDLSLSSPGITPLALGFLSTGQSALGPASVMDSRLTGLAGLASGLIGPNGLGDDLFGPDGLGAGFNNTLGTQLLSKAFDTFPETASWLGLGTPGYYDFAGSWTAPVLSDFGGHLATGINSAGWGAIGSFGANLAGLHPRNPLVGMAASGIGSVAGGTLGAMAGSAAGLAGTTLGSFAGPAGAVLGSFLGTALSSQIGPNPSVGPNGSAYLGFSGGRFVLGGQGSDNGGSSAQFAEQVEKAAARLNELMRDNGLYVLDSSQSFWSFGAGTPGVAPASYVEDAKDLVEKVLSSGRLASDNPEVQQALSGLSGTLDSMVDTLAQAAGFEADLARLQGVTDPTKLAVQSATAGSETAAGQFGDFLSVAEGLGSDQLAEATEAVRTNLEIALGLKEAVEPLTMVEQALAAIGVKAEAFGEVLEKVGISADEAGEGADRLRAVLAERVEEGLQGRLDALRGFGTVAEIQGLLDTRDLDLRNANAVGLGSGLVEDLFGEGLERVLEGQTLPALRRVIEAFGDVPAVAEAAGTALEALSLSVRQGFEAELNSLTGLGALNDVSRIVLQAQEDVKQAQDAGVPLDLVRQLAAERLAQALTGATLPALEAVNTAFGEIPIVANAVQAAIRDLQSRALDDYRQLLDGARGTALAAYRDTAQDAEQLMTSMRGLAEGLAQTRSDLATGSLSPLGPEARLSELATRFGDTAARARLGDREALGALSGVAQTYLAAAQDYHAATEPYAAIFAEVQAALGEAEGTANRQASLAEQQLDAARRQIDLLEDMVGLLGDAGSGNPLADFFGAVAGGSAAGQTAALARMTPDQIAAALGQFTAGSAEQAQIRRFLGQQDFGDGTQAALREQWQRLGEQAVAGTYVGDVLGAQLSILSRADAETLEYFISTIRNPQNRNLPAARAFLSQFRQEAPAGQDANAAIAGLLTLADQLDVQTVTLRLGNEDLRGALGDVRELLADILQQVKNGGLAA